MFLIRIIRVRFCIKCGLFYKLNVRCLKIVNVHLLKPPRSGFVQRLRRIVKCPPIISLGVPTERSGVGHGSATTSAAAIWDGTPPSMGLLCEVNQASYHITSFRARVFWLLSSFLFLHRRILLGLSLLSFSWGVPSTGFPVQEPFYLFPVMRFISLSKSETKFLS